MTSIYEQHDQAFRGVSSYVVLDDATNRHVARVSFTYARSGLRTTCYFHVLGTEMARAFASGGGYDKASAAAYAAVRRINGKGDASDDAKAFLARMVKAITDQGQHWDRDLSDAGFRVIQAV